MKKKFLSLALVLCLTAALSVPAFAANPNPNTADNKNTSTDDVTAPYRGPYDDSTTTQNDNNEVESYGFSTQTYDAANDQWITDSDDNGNDTDVNDGTDIYVWAKITGEGAGLYKIDIAWGAMKFVFNGGDGKTWNVDSHTYEVDPLAGGSTQKEWVVTGYLDGINNKIEVTNHSNRGVTANFNYAMEGTTDSPFNDDWESNADAVVGGFYATEVDAQTAAAVITAVHTSGTVDDATITGAWLKNNIWDNEDGEYDADVYNTIELPTADHYNHGGVTDNSGKVGDLSTVTDYGQAGNDKSNGERTESVYFAFSGSPDDGKSATLDNFTKVGVITVTVSPNESPALNHAPSTAP